jgi:hypothetical protein
MRAQLVMAFHVALVAGISQIAELLTPLFVVRKYVMGPALSHVVTIGVLALHFGDGCPDTYFLKRSLKRPVMRGF